jgi:hypothetical protein
MARLTRPKNPAADVAEVRRFTCNRLKSLAEMFCGGAEVAMQVIEIIAEVLRNVVPPIPPYELPQRAVALRSSFRKGSKRGRL